MLNKSVIRIYYRKETKRNIFKPISWNGNLIFYKAFIVFCEISPIKFKIIYE